MENLASINRRAVAFMLDDLIVSFLFIIIFYEQISSFADVQSAVLFIQANVIYLLLLKVLYHTFFIGYNGKTPGKALLKIKVVDEESFGLIGYGRAFLRAVVRATGEMFFYITFLPAFFSEKKQTLHDKLAKSIVVDA